MLLIKTGCSPIAFNVIFQMQFFELNLSLNYRLKKTYIYIFFNLKNWILLIKDIKHIFHLEYVDSDRSKPDISDEIITIVNYHFDWKLW